MNKSFAHDSVAEHRAGKNISQFGDAALNPGFAMFEGFLQVLLKAAEPRSAHTAQNAITLGLTFGSGLV